VNGGHDAERPNAAASRSTGDPKFASIRSDGRSSDAMSQPSVSDERTPAFLWVLIAYLVAAIVALLAGIALSGSHPIAVAAGADAAATFAVFAFSMGFGNSSFYDPYWSVAPLPIALYWTLAPGSHGSGGRQMLAIAVVTLWGTRLTWNWARGWTGLGHEDWRYLRIRERTGAFYWPASLVAIHLIPTVVVFLGCLPLQPALASGTRPLGMLDAVAVGVALAGVGLEYVADEQLRRFRLAGPPPEAILETGLWGYSRHPNYLGEILFWLALALFGLAAAGFVWWTWLGFLGIVAMFQLASLPMIERRMLERRPGYAARQRRVPLLIPWLPRSPEAK
jgi:steroid 5-alpha reductase family enzyme